jgi:hypothetical protein
MGAISHDDLGEHPSFDRKIEAGSMKLFFEAEDLIHDAWFLRISLLKAER